MRQNIRGFTLLEILIAVFIFSVAGVMLFATFNATVDNASALDQRTEIYEMGRNCLNRIIHDLQSIHISSSPVYRPPEFGHPPEPYHLLGDVSDAEGARFSRLRFTSTAHLPFSRKSRKDIAEIVYYIDREKDGGWALRRADNLFPYPSFEENAFDPILCDRVLSLKFSYYDQDDHVHDAWDSESDENNYATPVAIGVSITVGDPRYPIAFDTRITLPFFRKNHQQTDNT